MQQVKLPFFIKHAISISIVDLSLGATSMFEKLILLYHYCLPLNMLQQRFTNRISDLRVSYLHDKPCITKLYNIVFLTSLYLQQKIVLIPLLQYLL